MARALGIPARIAVGLVVVRRRVLLPRVARGLPRRRRRPRPWLPVDPTFNQFPADATHLRLARGGLDKQAAILPLIGRLKMTILDLELAPSAPRRSSSAGSRRDIGAARRFRIPQRSSAGVLARRRDATTDDRHPRISSSATARSRRSTASASTCTPGEIHGFLGPNGAGKTTTHAHDRGLLKPTAGRIVVNGHDLATRPRGGQGVARLHSRSAVHLREADRGRVPPVPRRAVRPRRPASHERVQRDARPVRAGALGERAGRELLARHEAAARHVRGVPASAAGRASSTSRWSGSIRAARG